MSVYTKTGDTGEASLFGGERVVKSNLQVECYGTFDELSSFIGFARVSLKNAHFKDLLTIIQKDLYSIMAVLSGSSKTSLKDAKENIKLFENTIDTLSRKMPKMTGFVITQNKESSARLNVARTVCRRAERALTRYSEKKGFSKQIDKKTRDILFQYINRLSDLLFILSRSESEDKQIVKA